MRKFTTLLIAGLLISSSSLWGQTTNVTVSAQVSNWTSTGVTITPEAVVTIEATGEWCGAPWSCYGPEGTGGIAPFIFLAPGLSSGGLVGKVGNNSPFFVGSMCSFNGQDHGTGTLYLAFNDEITGYYNNSGTLDVTITTTEEGGQTNLTAPFSETPPTIDGVINGTEWQGAQTYDLTFCSNVDQTTVNAPVYLLNDGTYLYCASTVPFSSSSTAYFGIYIDGDHSHSFNGTMSEPHVDIGYNKAGTNSPLYPIYDAYWAEVPPCGVQWSDMVTPPAGAEHAYSGTSELSYEFKIPLSDMTASPGETIGILLQFSPGGVGYMYPSADYCDIASWPDLYIAPGSQQGADILVYATSETTYGFYASSFDEDLPAILAEDGFTVTVTDRMEKPEITAELLNGYNQLWIMSTDPYSGSGCFSSSEISAILDFRNAGKGILIMADDGPPGHDYTRDANQISTQLGVTFSGQYNYGPYAQPFEPDFSPHPLFSGVQNIVCTENAAILGVNSPSEVVATYQGTNMIAVLDDGQGRVVFDVSFMRFWDEDERSGYIPYITVGNTPQYAKNIANWLSEGGQPSWTGMIHGQVMTYAFDLISGAAVDLYSSDDLIGSATTGSDGAYSFDDLPEGTYTLKTQAPGFEDGEKTVTLEEPISPMYEPIYLIVAPLDHQWLAPTDIEWPMGEEFGILLHVVNRKNYIGDFYEAALRHNEDFDVWQVPFGPAWNYRFRLIENDLVLDDDFPIDNGPVARYAIGFHPDNISNLEFQGKVSWAWIEPYDAAKFISELTASGAATLVMNAIDPLQANMTTALIVYEDVKAICGKFYDDTRIMGFDSTYNGQTGPLWITIRVSERKRYYAVMSILYKALGPAGFIEALKSGNLGVGILSGSFMISAGYLYTQAADPIDSSFYEIVRPFVPRIDMLANEPPGFARNIGFKGLEFIAYCRAMSDSYDKFLGASELGSSRWIGIQGSSYIEYLRRMQSSLEQIELGLLNLESDLSPISIADIDYFRAKFLNQGTNDALKELMIEYDWNESTIAEYRNAWVSADLSFLVGDNHLSTGVSAAGVILSSMMDSLSILPIVHVDCNIKVIPHTIVLSDSPDFIEFYLEFENPELIQYVENSSLQLNDGIEPALVSSSPSDFDGDGIPDLELAFSASDVLPLLELGSNALSVSGFLVQDDTTYFGAMDLVEVISSANSGAIAGIVSDSSVSISGVAVDLLDSVGNLIAVTGTDASGHYSFDSLTFGDYRVSIVVPLGFQVEIDEKPTLVLPDFVTPGDFALSAVTHANEARGVGYWKHQVNVYLSGKGNAQESLEQMSVYMNAIATHFNGNLANPVNILEVPQPATQNDSLETIRDLLTAGQESTMNEKARRHLTALLLNVASLKLHQTTIISEDSANASQAITYCYQLITDDNPDNDEVAKDIAETVNEGQIVPAGMIDPSTANIAYKQNDSEQLPTEFALHQNYPNPFNPTTEISFALPNASDVKLEIFNIMGQKVATVADRRFEAGNHTIEWNGSQVASGIYFYRLDAGDFVESRKMVLLK